MTSVFHLFLRLPLYVVLLLASLALAAYRATPGSTLRKVRHLLAFSAVIVYLGSIPAVSNALTRYLEEQYSAPELRDVRKDAGNVIVVLTAGSFRRTHTGFEARIGEDGWERLRTGIDLHERLGGKILFAGAPSPDGRSSVAGAMAEIARKFGIPDDQILVEEQSTNTFENIVFSRAMLDARQERVWMVTSALRMPRAMAVAARQGLEVTAYPCDFHGDQRTTWWSLIPANHATVSLERNLHEIIGLLVYRIRGWA